MPDIIRLEKLAGQVHTLSESELKRLIDAASDVISAAVEEQQKRAKTKATSADLQLSEGF